MNSTVKSGCRTILGIVVFLGASMHYSAAAQTNRALIIGIDRYHPEQLADNTLTLGTRDRWKNLRGAVNDASQLELIITGRFGFSPRNVEVLTNEQASRAAIIGGLQRLAEASREGDNVLFYFAGHGSQIRNLASVEPDQLDETIVPSDGSQGAPDITDKELRVLFNQLLDRGVELTMIFDSCNSGSVTRSETKGGRFLMPSRQVISSSILAPPPEEHPNALLLAASRESETAGEYVDIDGSYHGLFSWAFFRSLQTSPSDASVVDVFARTRALIKSMGRRQEPVLSGSEGRKSRGLFGQASSREEPLVSVIEWLPGEAQAVVQAGYGNGLMQGGILRTDSEESPVRLLVDKVLGLELSLARVIEGSRTPETGEMLRVERFGSPAGAPLRIWLPEELTSHAYATEVQSHAARLGVSIVGDIDAADYQLVRDVDGSVAWRHCDLSDGEPHASLLPMDPSPARGADQEIASKLTRQLTSLNRIWGWLQLESPPEDGTFAFQLSGIESDTGRPFAAGDTLFADGSIYRFVLRAESVSKITEAYENALDLGQNPQRYVYVFGIDSDGKAGLLFPTSTQSNLVPTSSSAPSKDLKLKVGGFRVTPPFGIDTFYMLTSTTPLLNPSALSFSGTRGAAVTESHPLEHLLGRIAEGLRAPHSLLPGNWSISRMSVVTAASK